MPDQIVTELAIGEIPDLDQTIPTGGNNQWHRDGWAEAHARDPFRVAFSIARDRVLALTQSIPQSNGGVAGAC